MKLQYGVILAMLMAGSAIAEEAASSGLPMAEKTSASNAASATSTTSETEMPEAMAAPSAATEMAAEEQSGFSRGSVVRSIFTTAVDNREPVDDINKLSADEANRVFYYTELRDMAGQKAKHRWEYNGEVMAEVEFNVKGPRWRVWSSKSFVPGWAGDWKVTVLNAADEVISEDTLTYAKEASAEGEAPATPSVNN